MLIHCPRCGFQQPKDKYCAQCGVDMENYRRPQPSFGQRLVGNHVLQVGAALAIAGVVGFSLYQRRQRDLDDRVNYLKNGVQIARSVAAPSVDEIPDETAVADLSAPVAETQTVPEAQTATASLAPPTEAAAKAALGPDGKPLPAAAAADGKAAATKPAAATGTTYVRVTFAEVPRAALEEIYEVSRATGQFNDFGDHIAGILPEVASRLAQGRNARILSREERAISAGRPVQFFQGVRPGDPENEVGFMPYIEILENDGTAVRASMDLMRSFKPVPGPSQRKLYPSVFELTRGSGFFMAGLLPAHSPLENNEELAAVPPFQILRSSAFRAELSSAVVFVEFEQR